MNKKNIVKIALEDENTKSIIIDSVGYPPYSSDDITKLFVLAGDWDFYKQTERRLLGDKKYMSETGRTKDDIASSINNYSRISNIINKYAQYYENRKESIAYV